MEDESLRVVLVPWPVMGHVQIVDFGKLLVDRHKQLRPSSNLSVTVLLMKLPRHIDAVSSSFIDSLAATDPPRVSFLQLPPTQPDPEWSTRTRGYFLHRLVQSQRSNVSDYLKTHRQKTVAVVTDMLCTCMIHVAEELEIPSFVFFTSPASFLGSMLHFQALHDEEGRDVPGLRSSGSDLTIPSFVEPVPPGALSPVLVDRGQWLDRFLGYARDYRKAKGIIVNSFFELESHALGSFLRESAYGSVPVPPVYAVGPILNRSPLRTSRSESSGILEWLDEQPPSSVVFVCFGSQGSLREAQVRELALGLERSGSRFLWSLRRQPSSNEAFPTEYADHARVLPDGFAERTAGKGRVVGWAPQLEVLSHPSVGGFVSHCGWNSVLESLWCGVSLAAWPLHSEQHMNACQLARDLGLAVEVTLSEGDDLVGAEAIAGAVREVMRVDSEVKKRVEEIKGKSRACVVEGGSSFVALERLIERVMMS